MQAELDALGKALEHPERPVAAIVGGAKISTKLDLLDNLLEEGRYPHHRWRDGEHVFARAGQTVGKTLAERDLVDTAKEIIAEPQHARESWSFRPTPSWRRNSRRMHLARRSFTDVRDNEMILDIGPQSDRARRLGSGALQDAGLERAVRCVRDAAVRHRHLKRRRPPPS